MNLTLEPGHATAAMFGLSEDSLIDWAAAKVPFLQKEIPAIQQPYLSVPICARVFPEDFMPVVPTTAYSQAEDVLSLARALLNDSSGAVFTDALLMPLLNSAYRGLQRELSENGVSVLTEQQDIELDVGPEHWRDEYGTQRRFEPATSNRLPCTAHALGTGHREHQRRLRSHGKVHERRQHVEFAAQFVFATLGKARG